MLHAHTCEHTQATRARLQDVREAEAASGGEESDGEDVKEDVEDGGVGADPVERREDPNAEELPTSGRVVGGTQGSRAVAVAQGGRG